MALYHFSVQIISRANGQSACAAAAYRSGEKIANDYDGITHDYRLKQNVEDAIVMLPENAPADFVDRSKLWNSVEQNERQSNAQLAREVEFALPRELPPKERKQIAIEFIQEQFVNHGMIADVCFHNPPKMNSRKQPVDAMGNVVVNPEEYIFENPHVHVMLPLRAIDNSGKWESKKTKLYMCEKDGRQELLSATKLKEDEGWEKLYHYETSTGEKEWHTKTYATKNPDVCIKQINRYPKCQQVLNPVVERWNNPENAEQWRAAWAEKINIAYEHAGLELKVDHRSYERQGIDLLPTIHEGKSITIVEKKLREEYEEKIANGEPAELKHTEVRYLNNAIREHNSEIKIIAEIKRLKMRLQELIKPIEDKVSRLGYSIAETLEILRAEIIVIRIRINKTVGIKGKADAQIISNQQYIMDLAPIRIERENYLRERLKSLEEEYAKRSGLLQEKRREEIDKKIENIKGMLDLYKDNKDYAIRAKKEINDLMIISKKTEYHIEQLKSAYELNMKEYRKVESSISKDNLMQVNQERLKIRPRVEANYVPNNLKCEFKEVANKIDDFIVRKDYRLSGESGMLFNG